MLVSVFVRLFVLLAFSASCFAEEMTWRFDVYLNEKAIGTHRFSVQSDQPDSVRVVSEADYRVKMLLLTFYRYQHQSEELWQQGCLQQISSSTNDNGDQLSLVGEVTFDGFSWQTLTEESGESSRALGCVRSFAYWNPNLLLQAEQLMNPQTGRLEDVTVEKVGTETLVVGNEIVVSRRYKLSSDEMDIELWYSPDNRWLALQSEVKNGRLLRYQASEIPERVSF